MSAPTRTARGASLLVVVGGIIVCVGSWLPWMSYFAGLVPLRGVIGLNGRLVAGAGLAAIVLGTLLMVMPHRVRSGAVACVIGLIGIAVTCGGLWLSAQVGELTHSRPGNAMLAPRPGAGLLVVMTGGLFLIVAALACLRGTSRPESW
jgi:hypothetical protein